MERHTPGLSQTPLGKSRQQAHVGIDVERERAVLRQTHEQVELVLHASIPARLLERRRLARLRVFPGDDLAEPVGTGQDEPLAHLAMRRRVVGGESQHGAAALSALVAVLGISHHSSTLAPGSVSIQCRFR